MGWMWRRPGAMGLARSEGRVRLWCRSLVWVRCSGVWTLPGRRPLRALVWAGCSGVWSLAGRVRLVGGWGVVVLVLGRSGPASVRMLVLVLVVCLVGMWRLSR